MIATYGLSHVALAVADPRRSAGFYQHVFGCKVTYEDDEKLELQTSGAHDVIALENSEHSVGEASGLSHFGFRLLDPKDIEAAVRAVTEAGGTIERQGEFAPGCPYAFVRDLDGYQVEIWFE